MSSSIARVSAIASIAALAVTLSACAGSSAEESATAVDSSVVDAAAASLVPEEIAESGVLSFATTASMIPNEYIDEDGKTIIGSEIDIARAAAAVLGLEAEFTNIQFDSIIPGIEAGRFDAAISTMTDTKAREEIVDMTVYSRVGGMAYFRADNPYPDVANYDDLCGYSVAVTQGSVDQQFTEEASANCVDAGDEAVEISVFPDHNASTLALRSSQVDISLASSVTAAYIAETSDGELATNGLVYDDSPMGIPSAKGSGLAEALAAAVNVLIERGTYQEILDEWGTGVTAVDEAVVNGAEK